MADWYIDSWSILDGIAFASLRDPWDEHASTLKPATTTVMLAPPDWRAVSIARLSTAMAATRSGFQEGVYDQDREIVFPDLATIRTVLRRAYIAGGVGLDDSGEAEAVTPPDGDLPGDSDWRELRAVLLDSPDERDRATARQHFVDLIGRHAKEVWGAAVEFSRGLAESTTNAWFSSSGTDSFRNRRDGAAILRFNAELGIVDPYEYYGPYSDRYRGVFATTTPRERLRPLARLPSLKRFPDYPVVRTLADQVFLASASRHCFRSLERMRDLLPLLMAGLVVSGGGDLWPWRPRDLRALVLERAAQWVAELVPERLQDSKGIELTEIETVLEELIRRIAGWRSGGSIPTPITDPEPGGWGNSPDRSVLLKELNDFTISIDGDDSEQHHKGSRREQTAHGDDEPQLA